jgi:hypothetical protein
MEKWREEFCRFRKQNLPSAARIPVQDEEEEEREN